MKASEPKKNKRKKCRTLDCEEKAVYKGFCRRCYLRATYSTIKLSKLPSEDVPWEPIVAEEEDDWSEITRIVRRKAS